jgi:hypothetical protein
VTAPRIPIDQQIREIDTVIRESDAAFARMVSNHKMRGTERDYRMNRLYAIKRTLEFVANHSEALREIANVKRLLGDKESAS